MTTLNRLIPVFVLFLLSPFAAHAASIDAKSLELTGFFSFRHVSSTLETTAGDVDLGTTVFELMPGLGYFLNPNWEILGNLIIQHQSQSDASIDHFGIKGSAYYHFDTTGEIIPFAGAAVGILTNGGDLDGDTSIIIPELIGGIRWPFKQIVSFNFVGGYRH